MTFESAKKELEDFEKYANKRLDEMKSTTKQKTAKEIGDEIIEKEKLWQRHVELTTILLGEHEIKFMQEKLNIEKEISKINKAKSLLKKAHSYKEYVELLDKLKEEDPELYNEFQERLKNNEPK